MMPLRGYEPSHHRARKYHFGPFTADARSGELWKFGTRQKLRSQAFQILLMLLDRPGQVISREEIRQKLWADDTVVEFDHGINTAVQQLRTALGESAGRFGYIETLKQRGYRFNGDVRIDELAERDGRRQGPRWGTIWLGLGVLFCCAALAGGIVGWREFHQPRTLSLQVESAGFATISPNGRYVAFLNAKREVMVRDLESPRSLPIYNAAPVIDMIEWSPDSNFLLFPTADELLRVRIPDGALERIAETMGPPRGTTWGTKGTILQGAIRAGTGGLYAVPAAGGRWMPVEMPHWQPGIFYRPEFLPDGENFLFSWNSESEPSAAIFLATYQGGRVTRGPFLLRKNATAGRYATAGGGMLLFVEGDRLFAQHLNARAGRLEGEPQLVVNGVYNVPAQAVAYFRTSQTGALVWKPGVAAVSHLTWFDRTGRVVSTVGPECDANQVLLSPDEQKILYTTADGGSTGAIYENNVYLTVPKVTRAQWEPDGRHIIHRVRGPKGMSIYERLVDGTQDRLILGPRPIGTLHTLTPDGQTLLYSAPGWQLMEAPIGGRAPEARSRVVVEGDEKIASARFSPDGRWFVYGLIGGDTQELYVRPYPRTGGRIQVSMGGGTNPVWRADGKEIVYRRGTKLYSVRVETAGGHVRVEAPKALFDVRPGAGLVGSGSPLAVTRDGARILFAQGAEQPESEGNYVMFGWDRRLKL